MKSRLIVIISTLTVALITVYAWDALPISLDPLVRMPGTQPNQGVALEGPGRCLNCHHGYDDVAQPGNWIGSMMAQSARDPIFWACYTVSLQDSIWAVGTPNAGDLCERCHFPQGWLEGRSDPPNATAMAGVDYDGIHCDFCHTMYDPFYEETYAGTRESADWINYWDEALNTGPTSGTLSQEMATEAYLEDRAQSANVKLFSGEDFYTNFNVPKYPTYRENTSGQFFNSTGAEKRASYADPEAKHKVIYSRYHKSKYMCGTCHDVSNPVLANLGLSGLPDQSGGTDLITEQYSPANYFHVERTFSEFQLSAYGRGGAPTNPEFQLKSGGIATVNKCQDCHMNDAPGYGCNKNGVPLRPAESTEHPNSGIPKHNMTGGNAWISHILASTDPTGPVYDPINAQLLDQGPAVLTLDMNAGVTPKQNGQALKDGADRAKEQLQLAATIKDTSYNQTTGQLTFKIQNNTGHKLISGFPEGRRMFLNIKAYASGELIYQANPYDYTQGTLRGLPKSNSSPALLPNEQYIDELIYEVHPKSDLTGEDETFHFVLATGRYKDNRIPPKGFDIANAAERISTPVWHGSDAPDYFTAEEYAGGYDQTTIDINPGADNIQLTLYYQGTSREYIEFLRDEINGNASSLTPKDGDDPYIIQTDPFFAQLKAWGDTIWQLWHHNHGLDGSGKAVAGIVPYAMTTAQITLDPAPQPIPGDIDTDGDVDTTDLLHLASQWLSAPISPTADLAPAAPDGIVNLQDFKILAENWRKTNAD